MENNKFGNQDRQPVEKFVLLFYSLQMFAMILVSMYSRWNLWVSVAMVFAMIGAISVYVSGYRNFWFRCMFITGCMEVCMLFYGACADGLPDILPLFLSGVALMGLYGLTDVIRIAFLVSVVLFVYRLFIKGELQVGDFRQMNSQLIQIASVFLTEFVIYFWIRARNRAHSTLVKVIEELQTAQKSKDDFLANVSHEIRTPVNTICGMSEMAVDESDAKKMQEELRDIQAAGRNLASVISDVLDFSELQSGKMELEEEAYNITSTMNDVIHMADAKKGDKPIELLLNCDPMLPSSLLGDEKKIKRVILNLVDNAIKFTEEGGVTIDISGRREDYGLNLVVSVKDTGIGMPEEHMEKLFTSFNQVDTHRNRKEGGIGLGLAISQALVNKMGGVLTVKSRLGKGSVFKFVVPQKILDETPIVSIPEAENLNVATYLGLEQFELRDIRDEYMGLIDRMANSLHIRCHQCMNLVELKRRQERETFTHIFIGINEYKRDMEYFNNITVETRVVLMIDPKMEGEITGENIVRIQKPFYLLSVISVLNDANTGREGVSFAKKQKFEAPQVKVLVVDDNSMNIRVIAGLLAAYKIKVDSATSGREALEKVERMEYDLIFMDHMMPQMDGVETLHHIRAKGKIYFQRVPVIALTANAIAGAREMFLAEGFTDYVEKPVEPAALERALRRNIPEEKLTLQEEKEPYREKVRENATSEELRIGDLDVRKGMMYCGGREKYLEVLKVYREDGDERLHQLDETYDKGNWTDYTIYVHAIKSSMMSIGATKLSDMARQLEHAGKQGDIDYILSHHGELAVEFARVTKLLAEAVGEEPKKQQEESKGTYPEIEEAKLKSLVDQMEAASYSLDREQMLAIVEELGKYQLRGEVLAQRLNGIRRKVEMSDYFSASDALKHLVLGGDGKES